MSKIANQCEICGRQPAKQMSFKAHQGFVLFRREVTVTGVFCRDCALAAYAKARGMSLKGMWFSPSSLVLGTLRSLWDSAQLLDLPPEVKDGPWVVHKVGCPSCRHAHYVPAGSVSCERCKNPFAVVSCAKCGTIHAIATAKRPHSISIQCRSCQSRSKPPWPASNTAILLFGQGLAELAGTVDQPGHRVTVVDWMEALEPLLGKEEAASEWLNARFRDRIQDEALSILRCTAESGEVEFIARLFLLASSLCDQAQYSTLDQLAQSFGFPPNCFANVRSDGSDLLGKTWWDVLNVRAQATIEEVQAAYRKLASRYHPDLFHQAATEARERATVRMKEINAAFEFARNELSDKSQASTTGNVRPNQTGRGAEPQTEPQTQSPERPRQETESQERARKQKQSTEHKPPKREAPKRAERQEAGQEAPPHRRATESTQSQTRSGTVKQRRASNDRESWAYVVVFALLVGFTLLLLWVVQIEPTPLALDNSNELASNHGLSRSPDGDEDQLDATRQELTGKVNDLPGSVSSRSDKTSPSMPVRPRKTEDGVLFRQGMTHFGRDEFTQAIESFDRAILVNRGSKKAYYYRGICHAKTGNWINAVQDHAHLEPDLANTQNEDFAEAFWRVGIQARDRGNEAKRVDDLPGAIEWWSFAISHLDTAIKLKPDYGRAYAAGSECYFLLGDMKRADQDWAISRQRPF